MYHLAIECSGIRGSVASFEGENLLTALTLPDESSSVQTLAPSLVALLNSRRGLSNDPAQTASLEAGSVGLSEKWPIEAGPPQFLSVTVGPGSFTSLRVGLATTKMLAYAWKIPIVAVCSLEAIAAAAIRQSDFCRQSLQPLRIISVINAFRGQVFAASWLWQAEKLHRLAPPQVLDARQWCSAPFHSLKTSPATVDELSESSLACPLIITGPGLDSYLPEPSNQASDAFELAPRSVWEPQAAVVGQIGWQKYQRGAVTTADALTPNYIRGSAAEEKK